VPASLLCLFALHARLRETGILPAGKVLSGIGEKALVGLALGGCLR
jgi:hypothetical protein